VTLGRGRYSISSDIGIAAESEKWGKVVRAANIKPE